jgi:hypothetical protein
LFHEDYGLIKVNGKAFGVLVVVFVMIISVSNGLIQGSRHGTNAGIFFAIITIPGGFFWGFMVMPFLWFRRFGS